MAWTRGGDGGPRRGVGHGCAVPPRARATLIAACNPRPRRGPRTPSSTCWPGRSAPGTPRRGAEPGGVLCTVVHAGTCSTYSKCTEQMPAPNDGLGLRFSYWTPASNPASRAARETLPDPRVPCLRPHRLGGFGDSSLTARDPTFRVGLMLRPGGLMFDVAPSLTGYQPSVAARPTALAISSIVTVASVT